MFGIMRHRCLVQGVRLSGPTVEEMVQKKIWIVPNKPFGDGSGLSQKWPMKGTERKFHIHRFPRVQRRDRVETRKTQDAVRVIKREPIRHPSPPIMPSEKEALVTEV